MRLVTAEEMRALDCATIEGGHASGDLLMGRAGRGVVEAMERRYGSLLALRVLVLCGAGNNGGDGFVAARHLAARGARVRVGLAGERARVSGGAQAALAALEGHGMRLEPADTPERLAGLVGDGDWDFALDALLGTGARGAPEGAIAGAVQALRGLDDRGTRVVAVDLPTGVDADTGEIARRTVRADLTVTFGHPKRGQWLYPGRAFVGALEVVDIGLLPPAGPASVELATEHAMAALLPRREPRFHKGMGGRVLVVGGSPGLTGAVALAAHAGTRAGAGYSQALIPGSLQDLMATKLTEEMTFAAPETTERCLAEAALETILAHDVQAMVLGPGLSRSPESGRLARRVYAAATMPLLLDADGLFAFAESPDALARAQGPRVLTPHLIEMARLTGIEPRQLDRERIDQARHWAERWKAVVVLKGAPTVTASPEGRVAVNPTGNPGMATAGSGDVLAGTIGALIAQGLAAFDAARLGVYAHGLAGDLSAARLGQHGMAAGDLIRWMPRALVRLAAVRDRVPEGRPAPTEPKRARPDAT